VHEQISSCKQFRALLGRLLFREIRVWLDLVLTARLEIILSRKCWYYLLYAGVVAEHSYCT